MFVRFDIYLTDDSRGGNRTILKRNVPAYDNSDKSLIKQYMISWGMLGWNVFIPS